MRESSRNWFLSGGESYARYRPVYPPELADYLAGLAPNIRSALDVGCGTGQLTQLLAGRFDTVTGVDPSADQIANAAAHPRIEYLCANAEALPDGAYDLITAAQAAHWFRLDAFYREVRRVAAPDALLSLISYGVLMLDAGLNERFLRFYTDEIGPYWPAERRLVDEGYQSLDFPFNEIAAPPLSFSHQWSLDALFGYISTWSAVVRAREAGCEAMLDNFYQEMAALWGDPMTVRSVTWPVNMRIGRVEK